jgi:exosome complex component CSL4
MTTTATTQQQQQQQQQPLPTLRFALGSTVVPGDRLGTIRQVAPGSGTYVRGGQIYASIVGTLQVEPIEKSSATADSSCCYYAVVQGSKEIASKRVLTTGDVVLGRVLRINNQQAVVEILAKNGVGLLSPLVSEGCIRREDVRTLASEEVVLQDNFLPGDVVLAKILSLGDTRRYLLTTAAPELGVVHAVSSVSGKVMVPTSWKEMKCPETGRTELRKVAKPRVIPTGAETETGMNDA